MAVVSVVVVGSEVVVGVGETVVGVGSTVVGVGFVGTTGTDGALAPPASLPGSPWLSGSGTTSESSCAGAVVTGCGAVVTGVV